MFLLALKHDGIQNTAQQDITDPHYNLHKPKKVSDWCKISLNSEFRYQEKKMQMVYPYSKHFFSLMKHQVTFVYRKVQTPKVNPELYVLILLENVVCFHFC